MNMTPRELFFHNHYLVIDDIMSPEVAREYYDRFKLDSINFPDEFTKDPQCPKSLAIYNYRLFLEILIQKLPIFSKVLEEQLLPTYSYARLYASGEVLAKHVDRPSCDISVTVHMGSDGTEWPIYFTRPNGEVVEINLKPGQGAMYLGCVSEHWRDAFEGQEYGQMFLHYVRARGEYWKYYFDKLHKKD